MSTFERIRMAVSIVVWLVGASGCDAEDGECLRFSDCASGLTCAAGRCVPPPSPSDASMAVDATATIEPDATSAQGDESDTDADDEQDDEASTPSTE